MFRAGEHERRACSGRGLRLCTAELVLAELDSLGMVDLARQNLECFGSLSLRPLCSVCCTQQWEEAGSFDFCSASLALFRGAAAALFGAQRAGDKQEKSPGSPLGRKG